MKFTKLIEINANDLFDISCYGKVRRASNLANLDFCRQNCRAVAKDESLFLMDGVNFRDIINKAAGAGCSDGFLDLYEKALLQGGELVLFHQDI